MVLARRGRANPHSEVENPTVGDDAAELPNDGQPPWPTPDRRINIASVQSGGILLCALDADDRSRCLVDTARAWASATRSHLVFVHACPTNATEASRDAEASEERDVRSALGVGDDELLLVGGERASAIRVAASGLGARLLVVASSATAAGRVGSLPRGLLREGATPLLITPRGSDPTRTGGPIVCAVSLGEHDEAAVRFARALAVLTGRRLTLHSVLGAQDAAMLAAAQARSSIAVQPAVYARVGGPGSASGASLPLRTAVTERAEMLAKRLLAVAKGDAAAALVVASRPGDQVSQALAVGDLWADATAPVLVVQS